LTAVLAIEHAKLLFDFRLHRSKPHRDLASPLASRTFTHGPLLRARRRDANKR
jgi:hypothetical protein